MNCEECSQAQASKHCQDCEENFCDPCDARIHHSGTRRLHLRPSLCPCGSLSVSYCQTCSQGVCASCAASHLRHSQRPHSTEERTGVYWDLTSNCPASPSAVPPALEAISSLCPIYIKAYRDSDLCEPWLSAFAGCQIRLQTCKDVYSLLLDITIEAARHRLSRVCVIIRLEPSSQFHLAQIQRNMQIQVCVSQSLSPLNFVPLTDLPRITERTLFFEACPIFQTFPKNQSRAFDRLIQRLKELAESGLIDNDLQRLVGYLADTFEDPAEVIARALDVGLLHQKLKTFGWTYVTFVGLKLESLSLESLVWTLRSLRRDEMMPVEKAIQSRMKEAFDLKPSPLQWRNLLEAGRSAYRDFPQLQITNYVDPCTGFQSQLIFPLGEEWTAADQMENRELREELGHFTRFMNRYFEVNHEALVGGRYGCAQFLQVCGPPELRGLSLGRLSAIVQVAINEGWLRYQKTLLVWSVGVKEAAGWKLELVRRAVVEALRENGGEVPLAQLPMRLKKRVALDLHELGFAKLKDLLGTIPGVAVELRGVNNPFAVLRKADSKDSTDHSQASSIEEFPPKSIFHVPV